RRHTRFSRDWSSDVCSSDLRLAFGFRGRAISYVPETFFCLFGEGQGKAFPLWVWATPKVFGGLGDSPTSCKWVPFTKLANPLLRSEERRVGKQMRPGYETRQ